MLQPVSVNRLSPQSAPYTNIFYREKNIFDLLSGGVTSVKVHHHHLEYPTGEKGIRCVIPRILKSILTPNNAVLSSGVKDKIAPGDTTKFSHWKACFVQKDRTGDCGVTIIRGVYGAGRFVPGTA